MNKSNVVARLTITRADNTKTIIEVHNDSTFSEFYFYYRQTGMKRSTKVLAFTRSRNQGLHHINAQQQTPGLEVIANSIKASSKALLGRGVDGKENPVTSIKLRIIRKREYMRLLHMAPMGMPVVKPIFPVRNPRLGILLLLPSRRVSEQVGG
jgi:hypothetical protein